MFYIENLDSQAMGIAAMLDEIINYVQSLQNQVQVNTYIHRYISIYLYTKKIVVFSCLIHFEVSLNVG